MKNPFDHIDPETLRRISEDQKKIDQIRKAIGNVDFRKIAQIQKVLERPENKIAPEVLDRLYDEQKKIDQAKEALGNIDGNKINEIQKAIGPILKLNIDFNKLRQEQELIDRFLKNQDELDQFKIDRAIPLSLPKLDSNQFVAMQYEQQSAAHLIARLQARYNSWCDELSDDLQPVIYAITGGVILKVESLTEESYHGVAIEGILTNTMSRGLLIAHQASLQLLCVAESVTPEQPKKQIGFFISSDDAS